MLRLNWTRSRVAKKAQQVRRRRLALARADACARAGDARPRIAYEHGACETAGAGAVGRVLTSALR